MTPHHPDDPGPAEPETSTRRLVVTHGSQIKSKRLVWWELGLVLQYAINLLAAREGKGKSTVASSWAARESRNGGTVLWIGTEESREAAIVPRLIASDADMDRVIFVDVQTELGTGALMFPLDLHAIERVIREHNVTMLFLDPAKAVVPPGFSGNDDIAVRQYLEPIAALADRCKVTIIGLAHFGKRAGADSGQLMLGSVAWSQVARCVLSIAEDPDTGTRVLTNTKANYVGTDRSVEFRIVSTTVHTDDGPTEIGSVEWLGDSTLDARDLLGGDNEDDPGERTAAEHWLKDYLTANGPTPSKVVKIEAAKERISERTLKRAKKSLGVIDESSGFPRTSTWSLRSGATDSQATPSHGPTGPTGPTGHDQREPDGLTDGPTDECSSGATPCTSGPTGDPITPPTPLNVCRQEPSTRSTIRVQGQEAPRCYVCGKAVVAGQGDAHLSCLSKHHSDNVTDLDTRRSHVQEPPKLSAREWMEKHIADLQKAGHKTVTSVAVLKAGQAAGFTKNNLRQAASAHPDIHTIDRKGGTATWSIEPGRELPEYRGAPKWLDEYLDRQTESVIRPDDVRLAGEAAGYPWHSVRRAAGLSSRIVSIPAHGDAKNDRLWQIVTDVDEAGA